MIDLTSSATLSVAFTVCSAAAIYAADWVAAVVWEQLNGSDEQ